MNHPMMSLLRVRRKSKTQMHFIRSLFLNCKGLDIFMLLSFVAQGLLAHLALQGLLDPWDLLGLKGLQGQGTTELTCKLLILWVNLDSITLRLMKQSSHISEFDMFTARSFRPVQPNFQ